MFCFLASWNFLANLRPPPPSSWTGTGETTISVVVIVAFPINIPTGKIRWNTWVSAQWIIKMTKVWLPPGVGVWGGDQGRTVEFPDAEGSLVPQAATRGQQRKGCGGDPGGGGGLVGCVRCLYRATLVRCTPYVTDNITWIWRVLYSTKHT